MELVAQGRKGEAIYEWLLTKMGSSLFIHLFDVEIYHSVFLPAYRAFVDGFDRAPIIALLDHLLPTIGRRYDKYGFVSIPIDVYQDYRDIVAGNSFYSSEGDEPGEVGHTSERDLRLFVDGTVAPLLVRLLCVPERTTFDPEQDMSNPRLMNHLYEHSRWIEDHFTLATEPGGEVLEVGITAWGKLFSSEELLYFEHELSAMPRPALDQELIGSFSNLEKLVQHAAHKTSYSLLLGGV